MSGHPIRSARESGHRPSLAVMLRYVAIAFIIFSTVAWTAVTIGYIRAAPEAAKRACAGRSVWSGASDAYYWCLQRVAAGGKP